MAKKGFSLSSKVLIAFVFMLVPMIAVFIISYDSTKDHLQRLIIQDIRTISENLEGDVFLFLEMQRRRVEDFATDGFIIGELAMHTGGSDLSSRHLSEYIKKRKLPIDRRISHIDIIDSKGRVAASSIDAKVGRDLSSNEIFLNALKGVAFTEKLHEGTGPAEIAITSPVRLEPEGEVLGYLVGYILVDELNRLLSGEITRGLGALTWEITKGYNTMEIYLVNSDKRMLTRSRFRKGAAMQQVVDTVPVRDCLTSGKEFSGFYDDYRGVEVAGASMCLPNLDWVLLTEIDREELMAPLWSTQWGLIATFGVVVALVIAFLLFILRSMVGQLRNLAFAADEVARGNYSVNLPVRSSDEIGRLSESFNMMARGIEQRTMELLKSEARTVAILENTTNLVYLKAPDGRYQFINKRFEKLFGVTKDEVAGKTDYDLFPADIAESLTLNDSLALAMDEPVVYDGDITVGGNRYAYIAVKFRLPANPSSVCCVLTDITELKRSEDALRKSEAGLANAQRMAHIGSWDWDIVNNELSWSDEIYRIFGLEKTEFGATYEAFLASVHPEDRESVEKAVEDALYGNRTYSIDHRIVLPDGAVRIVHEQGEVVVDSTGNPMKMSGTVQDITERKLAEEEVKRLNAELEARVLERTAELEASNRELESFSYSVAHDLRAPLRIIDGFSRAVVEDHGGKLDDEAHDYLRRVIDSSKRMGQLIDDLLNLSRLTRMEMHREKVDLSAMAAEVVKALGKNDPERKVDVEIEQGLAAFGDPRLLRVVLDNLLANAWKFTSKTADARIEFRSAGKEDGKKVYVVRDNGAGFEMKYVERLFGAFQRLHSSSEFSGTGVGLATVARIIGRHGGRVWAEGEVGAGAAFYFTI